MSRILFFVPWARYGPHFETDLELMERHLRAGDQVDVVVCDEDLPACDRNPTHDLARCRMCIGRREQGLAALSGPVRRLRLPELEPEDREIVAGLELEYEDVAGLSRLRVQEFDLGYAVLSTLISFFRDPDPLEPDNRALIDNLAVAALSTYLGFRRLLQRGEYATVYVFNGRFAITRAVLRACNEVGVTCWTHERGATHRHYVLYENTTVHDLDYAHDRILRLWEEAPADERVAVAETYWKDRAQGREQSWFSFTSDQQAGRLPDDWDASRHNVVLFNSSEDEFAAIGDAWRNPLYADQNEGVRRIAADLAADPEVVVYLRVHPNLREVDNAQTRAIAALPADQVRVIPADSPICSYALLFASSVVGSFGSTIGMEATYWGKPSVLAGRCRYERLGGVVRAESHDEVVAALLRRDAPEPDRTGALVYGYFLAADGIPYEHYEADGVFEGRFRGRRLDADPRSVVQAAAWRALKPLERSVSARRVDRLRERWGAGT